METRVQTVGDEANGATTDVASTDERAASLTARIARRKHVIAWCVIGGAVAARVGWAAWIAHAHPESVTSGDTFGYLGPARSLIETGHFNLSALNDTPMFLRTPGYPAFLVPILWLTDSEWAISPIQALFSAVPIVLTVLVGRRLMGTTAGLVAGVIVAVDPLGFAASGTILTETLASLTLIAIAAAAIPVFGRGPDGVKARHALGLGAAVAAATMVRPTTFYFPLVVLVFLALRFRRVSKRSLLVVMAAFMVPVVVLVGAWLRRNHETIDSWQLSGSQALTMYCWHAAEVEARVRDVSILEARRDLECHPGGRVHNLDLLCPSWWNCDVEHPLAHGPSWDEMNRRGFDIVREHPVEAAQVYLSGLGRELAAPGTETVRRYLDVDSSVLLVTALVVWNVVLWSLAVLGAVMGLRSRLRWYWGFVITTVVYLLLMSAGANAGARFRTPIVPLLALLAALGARDLARRAARRRLLRRDPALVA